MGKTLEGLSFASTNGANAATEGFAFAVSPMTEKILLNPGDSYSSSFMVYNPVEYTDDVDYSIEVVGYYVDENYGNVFEKCEIYCEMTDWITINSPTQGVLSPGEKHTINYTINVPSDAPGGGQYASIKVDGNAHVEGEDANEESNKDEGEVSSSVKEIKSIAYIIYAEISGDTIRQGDIEEISVPSFLLSGNIKGASSIKNIGNVHGEAKYKLQVFPLFSDEEVYTNEEDPATATILPDRTRYEETAWDKTPSMGIFNVKYTVEFEGVTSEVTKMVIICPIWLLFLILFIIIALVIWGVVRAMNRKQDKKRNKES